jgi:hypothetical protein
MPDHHTISIAGRITHVFGHRFVVQTDRNSVLADVTPKGLGQIELHVDDSVELTGEMKPSELKVTRFTRAGKTIAVEHRKKHHDHHGEADPDSALRAAKAAGFVTHGAPRRKPKHFEVLGERDRHFTELHIELDGHIRKMKPVDRHDPKWARTISV